MTKLKLPITASITKQINGDWYIRWKNPNRKIPFREKFGLNRIKDLGLRQRWADKICSFINAAYLDGKDVEPSDLENFKFVKNKKSSTHDDLPKNENSFLKYIYSHLENIEGILSEDTFRHRKTVLNNFSSLSKTVFKKDFIDFSDLDLAFPLKFQRWAFEKPREWSKNYASKQLSTLILFVKEAVIEGIVTTNPLWFSKKYKIKQTATDSVALSFKEVNELYLLEMDDKGMEKARDIFVFACLTGLRFVDFSKIKPSYFTFVQKKRCIIFKSTQKTDEKVVVPLHPIALAIEHKYQGDFRCYTNQTMNDYIKLVCEAAGWRQVVTMKENIGGKTVLVDYPFFEVVSCHTARRTFATMAYLEWKMPIGLCMKITGHKTERQFLDYIKVSKEQAALEMIKYFNY